MCVLLVEDEPLISTIMAECLAEAGYDVIQAVNGTDALALVAREPREFTVLVTDINLADGPSGIDVARRVRALFPRLPVIVATGRPDALDAVPPGELAHHLISKPYRPSELIDAVRRAIGIGPHEAEGGHVRDASA